MAYSQNVIKNDFTPKRKESIILSDSYNRLGYQKKSDNVSDCGTILQFAYLIDINGHTSDTGKLYMANFCKDRLCPMCAWRRSFKIFGQVSQIMNLIGEDYKFLFLTLTVPNCQGFDLPNQIDYLLESWYRFFRIRRIKNVVRGWFRSLEITRNMKDGSFHPHFHVILAVPKNYNPHSGIYIHRDEFLQYWRQATGDWRIVAVDIRLCRPKSDSTSADNLSSAVAEIAKYTVKSSDYLFKDNKQLTDSIVSVLTESLHHRRLTSYGGCFKRAFQQLKLDDAENGDLVNIDNKINPELSYLIVQYGWTSGIYKMNSIFLKHPSPQLYKICNPRK